MSSPQNLQNNSDIVLSGGTQRQSKVYERVQDTEGQLVTHANQVVAGINLEEVCVHFGIRADDHEQPSAGVAKIYMSLPAFKRFVLNASALLSAVETATGVIDTNPNVKLRTPEAEKIMRESFKEHFQKQRASE